MMVVVRRQHRPDMRYSSLLRVSSMIHQMTEVLNTKSMTGRRSPNPGITALKAVTIAMVKTFEIQGDRNKGAVFRVCIKEVGRSMDWVVMWFSEQALDKVMNEMRREIS